MTKRKDFLAHLIELQDEAEREFMCYENKCVGGKVLSDTREKIRTIDSCIEIYKEWKMGDLEKFKKYLEESEQRAWEYFEEAYEGPYEPKMKEYLDEYCFYKKVGQTIIDWEAWYKE